MCVCVCVFIYNDCLSVCLSVHPFTHLPEDGVLVVKLISSPESEEKLASVVVGSPIGHAHHPSSNKLQTRMKLIL